MGGESTRSIFGGPWTGLTEFVYHWNADDPRSSYIELVLIDDKGRRRRLRFTNPRAVKIPEAGFALGAELYIDDVRDRQMEAIGVRVWNYSEYEGYSDSPSFWAQRVEEGDDDAQ